MKLMPYLNRLQARSSLRTGCAKVVRMRKSGLDLHQVRGWFRGTRIPALRLYRAGSQAVHQFADADRTSDEVIDFQRPRDLNRSDPVQGAADRASALRAIRRAAKNARLYATLQIGRIIGGHLGKKAIIRTAGRIDNRFSHSLSD